MRGPSTHLYATIKEEGYPTVDQGGYQTSDDETISMYSIKELTASLMNQDSDSCFTCVTHMDPV